MADRGGVRQRQPARQRVESQIDLSCCIRWRSTGTVEYSSVQLTCTGSSIGKMLSYELVIVTGCMRSGTSLLYGLISTSPDVGPPLAAARYFADFVNLYRRYRGSDRPFATDYFLPGEDMKLVMRQILTDRLDAAWTNSGKPACLVIRSVDFAPMIPLVADLLPDAQFVVSARDPKDTITSILKVGRKQKLLGLTKTSPAIKRDISRLCKNYNGSYLPGLRAQREQPSLQERLNFVRYEDAARDPADALSGVWARLGMAPGSHDPDLSRRPSLRDLASHRYWRTYITDLHNGPASVESVGSHGLFLSEAEARAIDRRCRHVRRVFGYTGVPAILG